MSHASQQPHQPTDGNAPKSIEQTNCCIVGGGPAGAMPALLLARQAVGVTQLEAHADFNRDFRCDGLQPAVLEVLAQMGLADPVLELALARLPGFALHTQSETVLDADVSHLETAYPFNTMVPQVRFLEAIVAEAQRCPTFRLVMGARVEALVQDGNRHVGGFNAQAPTRV